MKEKNHTSIIYCIRIHKKENVYVLKACVPNQRKLKHTFAKQIKERNAYFIAFVLYFFGVVETDIFILY